MSRLPKRLRRSRLLQSRASVAQITVDNWRWRPAVWPKCSPASRSPASRCRCDAGCEPAAVRRLVLSAKAGKTGRAAPSAPQWGGLSHSSRDHRDSLTRKTLRGRCHARARRLMRRWKCSSLHMAEVVGLTLQAGTRDDALSRKMGSFAKKRWADRLRQRSMRFWLVWRQLS